VVLEAVILAFPMYGVIPKWIPEAGNLVSSMQMSIRCRICISYAQQ